MSLLLMAGYFAAGMFREVLLVSYYRTLGRGTRASRYSASGLAGGIELYDWTVLATIVQGGWNVPLILAYTVGVMLGTFWATRPRR